MLLKVYNEIKEQDALHDAEKAKKTSEMCLKPRRDHLLEMYVKLSEHWQSFHTTESKKAEAEEGTHPELLPEDLAPLIRAPLIRTWEEELGYS
jgi:hypothetical protein